MHTVGADYAVLSAKTLGKDEQGLPNGARGGPGLAQTSAWEAGAFLPGIGEESFAFFTENPQVAAQTSRGPCFSLCGKLKGGGCFLSPGPGSSPHGRTVAARTPHTSSSHGTHSQGVGLTAENIFSPVQ